ncbi:MAG: aminotransferase class V-fold PLP-dependent enzyme [Bacteroidota bacterium]
MLDLSDRFVLPPSPDGLPVTELRAFTHGLMPVTVPAMMEAFTEDWVTRGVDAWNRVPDRWDLGHEAGWWTLPEALGDRWIAPMLGAAHGTCVMQPNVHWTVAALLSCDAPFEGRTGVVLSEADFPSVRHSVRQWSGLREIAMHEAPARGGRLDVDVLLSAITDNTAWVFVSHVGFATGELQSTETLRAIADRAHRHGALFCVDGYHATGSVDVDVEAIGADVYVGGLLKEASGSTGNSYLYVREGLDLRPRLAGWFADADPFGFNADPQWHPEVRRRFLAGTTAIASLYHAVEGLRILLGAGLAKVRADSVAKTGHAIERLDVMGLPGVRLRSPREAARRGAMVVLEVPEADQLSRWLKTRGVFTDSRRNEVVRFSPFVWNGREDVDRCLDAIAEGITSGTYLTFEAPAEAGPVT